MANSLLSINIRGFENSSIEGAHGLDEGWNAKQAYFELHLKDLAFRNEKITQEN